MKFYNLFSSAMDHVKTLRQKPRVLLSTGLHDLDDALGGGIGEGEVVVCAARPSHGKTSFAMNMLLSMAEAGEKCLMVSEEMRVEMLSSRMVQMATALSQEHWPERFEDVYEDIAAWWGNRRQILIAERCGNVEAVCQAIKEARDNHGVSVAAVDYLQLIKGGGSGRYEQVTNVSVALKHCAIETGVTLLICCQLGRQFDQRGDGKPRFSDLKESGQIEQDADVILFLYWPIRSNGKYGKPHEYHIFVGKNRNRGVRTNFVKCHFDASRQTFSDGEASDAANFEQRFEHWNQ